ncbi:hypothetical protein ACL5HQ_11540 [Stenotrophomonas maltophilia]|uniref:hypothetical protein n=1 Tax=Stenotrophomonas TaxID=40323 RepID=UPI001EF83283|nr:MULTISPECIES: hypothetical protein [Stenotrophomonas]MDG9987162.1 hypothetical protein [Stenotrophomonas sp. GD04024]
MHAALDHADDRTAARRAGWMQRGGRWDLWWNGRPLASIVPDPAPGVRLYLHARLRSQAKCVAAGSLGHARRCAERWWAVRLYPQVPLREAVARLVGARAPQVADASPGPLSREQRQQARRLATAGTAEIDRIRQALALRAVSPRRPDVQVRTGTWPVSGQAPVPRGPRSEVRPTAPHARSSPRR